MVEPKTNDKLAWSVHISLLIGLLISAALLILGGILMMTGHAPNPPQGAPPTLLALVSQAAKGNGAAILDLGLFVLMLTPVARVVVLAIGWLLNRQWRFGLVALCVLVLLGCSILLGTG